MTNENINIPQLHTNFHDDNNFEYFDTDRDDMSPEKRNLLNKLRKVNLDNENIENLAKELNINIEGLHGKIHAILNKHYEDYVTTFDTFLDTVQKDLKQKFQQKEKVEKEKRKNNDIKIITCEREFFRQEAIRLNSLCKELNGKLDELTREYKYQANELENVSKKWKESENTNKQLLSELNRNIEIHEDLKLQLNMVQKSNTKVELLKQPPEIRAFESHFNTEEQDDYQRFSKDKLLKIMFKLKEESKREKARNHKILAEFNKFMLEKNKLEKIFIDCVEESKKDILTRKFKENFSVSNNKKLGDSIPKINNVKYENFLPSDKKKLVELFLLKEEVINTIKEQLFSPKYDDNIQSELSQTKSSFMKTDKYFSSHRKKTPSTGFTYTMQINRSKTPMTNIAFK